MKTTLHYIIAILLFSLNATLAFAEEMVGPFSIAKDDYITCSYNEGSKLLTISGRGSITITGNGSTIEAGIVIADHATPDLTIKDLNIVADKAVVFENYSPGQINYNLILQGTNRLESTTGPGIDTDGHSLTIKGSGSLTVIGGNAAVGIKVVSSRIEENACIVVIGGEGASGGIDLAPDEQEFISGLLISGTKQTDGSIKQDYSKLKGNKITLGGNLEIPKGATVTIPADQSIIVPKGITLTNKGSIINEGTLETENGTLVNEGTIKANGIITSSKFLNIGGEDGFDVSTDDNGVTFSYDNNTQLLTISGGGGGRVLLEGIGKNNPVNCGIVIIYASLGLTIKDLNIKADNALVFEDKDLNQAITNVPDLKGTNRLESISGPGINLNRTSLQIQGSGSLTVIGGNAASGIQGIVNIKGNVCIVAIGGEGASGGIYPAPTLNNGLLISGTKQADGSIKQDYSGLKGNNVILGGNLEIPKGATVTIADGQSITVPDSITLTNKGSIINEGTLTNEGSIINEGTLETKNGTLVNDGTIKTNDIITSSKFLNIGGEDGFNVSTKEEGATFTYNDVKKLLTISGSGDVLLEGIDKNNPVNCGIVIEKYTSRLTIKDLNIRADNALVFEGNDPNAPTDYSPDLQGTNRLESTKGVGINLKDNSLAILGSGSLTVIGGDAAYGIQGSVSIKGNVCIVAIGGKEASGGINPAIDEQAFNSGLLISGKKQADGSIKQDYSELKGDITLGDNLEIPSWDLEIPSWADVTIADGQTFTIDRNVTLTNNGIIENKGTIKNKGTLAGKAVTGNQPEHFITFKANDSASTADVERYITEGKTLPTDIFTRSGYTFQGWFADPDSDTKVETIARPQTLYAQWKANKQPDPEPEPPTPVYYSVYLPQIEGATTNPGPGEHKVESWSTFRFYLTIDSAYSDSQPVVTTDSGETLQPRTSDGAYLVKYVRSDVEVFIDGIFKNSPVANEAISADALAPQIWAEGSMLCIRMPEAVPSAPVRIFTVDGRQHAAFASTPGLNRRPLPTGIYIVRIGDTACKVIIK